MVTNRVGSAIRLRGPHSGLLPSVVLGRVAGATAARPAQSGRPDRHHALLDRIRTRSRASGQTSRPAPQKGEELVLDYEDGGHLSVVGECPTSIPKRAELSSGQGEPMRGNPLTDRQREALNLIRSSIRERGRAPSHSEIAAAMKLKSSSGVEVHLKALAKKGWIENRRRRAGDSAAARRDAYPRRRAPADGDRGHTETRRGVPEPAQAQRPRIGARGIRVEAGLLRARRGRLARPGRFRERRQSSRCAGSRRPTTATSCSPASGRRSR